MALSLSCSKGQKLHLNNSAAKPDHWKKKSQTQRKALSSTASWEINKILNSGEIWSSTHQQNEMTTVQCFVLPLSPSLSCSHIPPHQAVAALRRFIFTH